MAWKSGTNPKSCNRTLGDYGEQSHHVNMAKGIFFKLS